MNKFPTMALSACADFYSGGTPSKAVSAYWHGGIPWLTPKDMAQWNGSTEETVSEAAIGNGTRLAPAGAVFIAVRGMSLHNEIRIIRADKEMAFNQDVKALVPKAGTNGRFLYYALLAKKTELLDSVEAAGHGTGRLPTDRLENVSVPDVSPAEQTELAEFLGVIDAKIDLNSEMNHALEATARLLYKDWLVDVGPTRAKEQQSSAYLPPELWAMFPDARSNGTPIGWRAGSAQEVVELNPKESLTAGTVAPYLDMSSLPTVGPNPQPPVLRQFTSGMRFRNGDALLARITPCLENGKAAFVQTLPDDSVGWGSTEFIVMRAIEPAPKPVSYLLARDPEFKARAVQSMTGTSGRQRARSEVLAQYPLLMPAPALWQQFGNIVNPMFERIRANDYETRALATMRDVLLPKLLSGELRLKDAEKEIGETV